MDQTGGQRRLEIGRDCIALVTKRLSRQISDDEYYIALRNLHEKYPMLGHSSPLSKYQLEHYRDIGVKHESPKGVEYLDYVRPWNFAEAAEMFIRTRSKPIDRKSVVSGEVFEEVPF